MARVVDLDESRPAFESFVRTHSQSLLRAAWLLTGDEAFAQDLVQTAIVKTWSRWDRLSHVEAAASYTRRVMLSTILSWRRRRWNFETPSLLIVEHADARDEAQHAEVREIVSTALARLSKGQRAAVVLRYFCDLSEAESADALGCSVGTVKSQTARALERLRSDPQMSHLWTGRDHHD